MVNNILSQVVPDLSVLPERVTNVQWASHIWSSMKSNSHPIGTAAVMRQDLGGVVDPQLKVYGTSNLRVVDDLVLPT